MCQADMQACDHESIEMEEEGSRSNWDGEKMIKGIQFSRSKFKKIVKDYVNGP